MRLRLQPALDVQVLDDRRILQSVRVAKCLVVASALAGVIDGDPKR